MANYAETDALSPAEILILRLQCRDLEIRAAIAELLEDERRQRDELTDRIARLTDQLRAKAMRPARPAPMRSTPMSWSSATLSTAAST
jgi:hypothetical protein